MAEHYRERCGECRLFVESPHKHFDGARCVREGWVDEARPACKHFVPMPRERRRVLWSKEGRVEQQTRKGSVR